MQFAFRPATAHNVAGAYNKGTLKEAVTYYRRLQPRRMVITGAAGSGKTVLAVELTWAYWKTALPMLRCQCGCRLHRWIQAVRLNLRWKIG